MEIIHLAYLIEVAIILNFALRELNIKDLISVRRDTEEKIKLMTNSDTVDESHTKNCTKRIQALIYATPPHVENGAKVDVWSNSVLRWIYGWIIDKKALVLSAISIIINIIILYIIVISHSTQWFYHFLALITLTIVHPLILIFSSNKIKSFLLGDNGDNGKILELLNHLSKSIKEQAKVNNTTLKFKDK